MAKKVKSSKRNEQPAKRKHEDEDVSNSDSEKLVNELDEDFDEVAQLLGDNVQDPEKKSSKQQKKEEKLAEEEVTQSKAIKPAAQENDENDEGEDNYDFEEAGFSEPTLKAIRQMGFKKMTKVQAKTIPPLLAGRDVL